MLTEWLKCGYRCKWYSAKCSQIESHLKECEGGHNFCSQVFEKDEFLIERDKNVG